MESLPEYLERANGLDFLFRLNWAGIEAARDGAALCWWRALRLRLIMIPMDCYPRVPNH